MEPGLQSSGGREFVFGPYVLDPTKRLLWRDGAQVALTPKSLDVLLVLIEYRDRIVEKDELLTRIWGDTVVEESTLVRSVSRLRKALDERPDQHDYVVTIPGHGYRFVAAVSTRPARSAATATPLVPLPDTPSSPAVAEAIALPVHAVAPVPVTWRASSRPFAATLAVLIGVVGVLALAQLTSLPNAAAPPQRMLRQITYDSGLQSDPTWSPDGQSLAYASDKAGNSDIWVRSIQAPNPVRITSSPAREYQPAWSPDGKWIAFRSEHEGGGLYVMPATGGAEKEKRVASFGYKPRWSPDGTRLLFSSFSLRTGEIPRLYTVGLDGGAPKPVRADLTESFRAFDAAWHPDGRVSIWGRQLETGWMFVTAPVMGTSAVSSAISPEMEQQLREGELTLGNFLWSPSGRYLYFEGRSQHVTNLWRVTVDARTLAWTSGPERLTTGPGRDGHIAISPDGTKLAFTAKSERTRMWSVPFDASTGKVTGPSVAITDGTTDEQSPDAPPDGGKLLYFSVRGANRELRERTLPDGEDRVIVAPTEGWVPNKARWSRDGARLMYIRSRVSPTGDAEERAVMIMQMDGAVPPVSLGNPDCRPSDWSPDGTLLVGSGRHGSPRRTAICLLPVVAVPQPTAPRILAYDPDLNLYQQRFSPDQRYVLFMGVAALEAGASRLYVMPLSGGAWTPLTDGHWFDDKPRWAPDGRTIYFASNRGGTFNVWGRRFDPATGEPVGDIFRVTSFDSSQQMLSPDHITEIEIAVTQNRLILPLTDASGEIWILGNVDR